MAVDVLTLPQAIHMALKYRSELKSAELNNESARLGLVVTESQLGWQANARAGLKHDLDMFGQPTEQQQLSAGLSKQQRSGNQISVQGSYQKDNSQTTGVSIFPNPLESYGVNLDYRIPLQRGRNNLAYEYAQVQSKMAVTVSSAEQRATADKIGEQLITIYHQLLASQIRMTDIQNALQRTQKLGALIKENSRLGMADKSDRLSVRARRAEQLADKKQLQRERLSQLIELQKMVGPVRYDTSVANYNDVKRLPGKLNEIWQEVSQRDAVIASNEAKLQTTESLVRLNRDQQKNKFDVVLSIGNETRQGQRVGGDLNENEWVGGVRLEYQLPLDRKGVDAHTQQTMLELTKTRIDNQRYKADLKNLVQRWYQEWQMTTDTIKQFKQRKLIEIERYNEVKERYMQGRTDIREMLDAEASLSSAEKKLSTEEARRSLVLALLSNRLGIFSENIE